MVLELKNLGMENEVPICSGGRRMKYKILISFEKEFEDYDEAEEYASNMTYDEDHNKTLDVNVLEDEE